MNMLKRTLAAILVFCMVLSAVPMNAFATEDANPDVTTVEDAGTPTAGEVTPAEGEETPAEGEETPAEGEETPAESEETPAEVEETPAEVEETPAEVEETPAEVEETPAEGEETPAESEETPAENEEPTEAAEEPYTVQELTVQDEAADATDSFQYRILHLDCGRKYFTADWIKALINEMAAAGYNQLQLAFGNEGLRFLLDDMSVTVNSTTYSDADVTAGIQLGNNNYYDAGDVNELTQAEMDEIIAYAKTKNIEIVPHMNMPGHMNAILDAIEYVGISDAHFTGNTISARSINLNNDSAVAFAQALLAKYVEYFDSKGCTFFHIGADEYANDAYGGSMGFPSMGSTLYGKFADYVNACAAIVKNAGMTPRAWNDGISYGNGTDYDGITNYSESFDTGIQVTYWSSGWGSGYATAPATTLRSNGHDMINTNGDFYYILGVNDCYTAGTTTTHEGYDYTAAESFSNTAFMGSTVSDPVGSMFCIWADVPGAETETEVAKYVRPILRVMGARMQDSTSYDVDATVSGGFNADGTINGSSSTEPTPVQVTVTDENTQVSVTAYDLTGVTAPKKETSTPWTGYTASVTYDVSITDGDGAYTDEAEIKIPYDATVFAGCNAFIGNVGTDTFTVTVQDGFFVGTVPHFSDVTISGLAETVIEGEDKIVTGSGTTASYVLDTDGLDVGAQYLIVYNGNALTNTKGSLAVTVNGNNATPSGDASAALWTYSATVYGNYSYNQTLSNGSNYLYTSTTGGWNDRQYNLNIDSTANTLTITNNSDGTYTIYRSNYGNVYVNYTDNGWGASTSSQNLYFYKYTAGTQTITVDAALQESRIAAYTVTNDGYTEESWNAYQTALTAAQEKLAQVKAATYTSETAANIALTELITVVDALEAAKNALVQAVTITIKYVDENGATVKTETKNVANTSTSITLTSPIYDEDSNCYTFEDTTLELDLANTTNYTVNVTYVAEDLTKVNPLEIEYWQTNGQVVESIGSSVNSKTITAESAYSENGIDLTAIIPQAAYKATATEGAAALTYWRCRLLPRATNEQTDESGDDETLNGVGFTKVRYWNGSWAVYNENNEWQNIDLDTYQLVAYYMNNMNLADEVRVGTADWGKKGNGDLAGEYLGSNNVSIAFQVVYEDGTTAPAGTDAASLAAYSYLVDNYDPRGVGTIALNQIGDYQIWKVTAETGTHTTDYNNSAWTAVNITKFAWDNNEMTVWEDAENPVSQYTIVNPAGDPSKEGAYANLTWDETNESILIRIYVKTVETEDSLTVIYYDEKFGDTLYTYNISVPTNSNFNNGIVLANTTTIATPPAFATGSDRINVTGYGIVNALGKTQNFQTDLTKVPEAVGKYKSELYTYTGSKISEDGKILYLYYNIDTDVLSPNFVIDFGLPFTFNLSDVTNTSDLVKSVTASARYGTVVYDSTNKTFTYTPTTVLQNVDVLSISILFDGASAATLSNVGVTPATTVHYEASFLENHNGWSEVTTSSATQDTEVLGQKYVEPYGNNYGYQPGYTGGSASTSSTIGSTASFTFTGNGIQVYANSTPTSGYVSVQIRNAQGNLVKLNLVDTVASNGDTTVTDNQNTNLDNLPIVSVINARNLPYGTYTVTITKVMDTKDAYIAGFRVFNTLQDSSVYAEDLEDNPKFYELRDYVLNALDVSEKTTGDYGSMTSLADLAAQVYAGIAGTDDEAPCAVVLGKTTTTIKVVTTVTTTTTYFEHTATDNDTTARMIEVETTENHYASDDTTNSNPLNTKTTTTTIINYYDADDNVTETINTISGANVKDGYEEVKTESDKVVTESTETVTTAQDLLDNGPKNELYLHEGESLVFKVTTNRDLQIGLKAPNGSVPYTITQKVLSSDEKETVSETTTSGTIATSVDMFYDMGVTPGTSQIYEITISNTGSKILSVTLLKVCDDPSFAFLPLTVESIESALYSMGYRDPKGPSVPMHRMYDPNSGEHFYTGSQEEKQLLMDAGWQHEGVGFNFPEEGKPVYRLYEPVDGEHLYTMDEAEIKDLVEKGWKNEGVAFNSAGEDEVPQYRLHNPNVDRGGYHMTGSEIERDNLINAGWIYQGIGWYSCEE